MPSLVFLWTDILIFLLFTIAVWFGIYASRHKHLRAPWSHVVRSRIGVATLTVLSFYLITGLLDSVHFHPTTSDAKGQLTQSTEILSLLDQFLTPLRERQEKTYSAPLATHLFSKENITQPDGTTLRGYPRLKFGGEHLADPQAERTTDILLTLFLGLLKALLLMTIISYGLVLLLARRRKISMRHAFQQIITGSTSIPWLTLLGTLAIILAICCMAWDLSMKYHLLGTDKVGEDVLYQSMKSIRTGLMIGTLTTLIMLPAAILLGIMAGFYRGWVDDVIQYLYTTLNSIPGVLLIAASILMLQIYMSNHAEDFNSLVERADLRLLFLCIILGVTSWTGLCRLLRGESIKLRELDYVQAAQAFGVSNFQIILRHILPNVLHIVLITVALDFSGLVLAEAVLSYVNIGVDPTMNSWGNMINGARLEMAREPIVWWSLTAAFIFMFILVLSANLFSDVVRDAFDPRIRNNR